MNVVCGECGTVLQKETGWAEKTKLEKEFSRICEYEKEYRKDREAFLKNTMEGYLKHFLEHNRKMKIIEERYDNTLQKQEAKDNKFWGRLVKSIVEDHKTWKRKHDPTNLR